MDGTLADGSPGTTAGPERGAGRVGGKPGGGSPMSPSELTEQAGGQSAVVQAEDHTLALAQHAEGRTDQGPLGQVVLVEVACRRGSRRPRPGVLRLDHIPARLRDRRCRWRGRSPASHPGHASVTGLHDLAGLDAAGADVQALGRAVDQRPHPLDVRVPATLGAPVGVAHGHAEARLLAAHVADRCHKAGPRYRDGPAGVNPTLGGPSLLRSAPMPTAAERLDATALRGPGRRLPRRPRRPPRGDQPPQRLPGPRRRHRHEHGPDPPLRCARSSTGPTADLAAACKAISHGSLMGGRGNSGVILSQVLRGICRGGLRDGDGTTAGQPPPLHSRAASAAAYEAVHATGRGHDPHRRSGEAAEPAAVAGGRRRCSTCSKPPGPRAADALGPHAARCSRCWRRPGWSTPGAAGSCCCSTCPCTWSTAGRRARAGSAGRRAVGRSSATGPEAEGDGTATPTCATRSCTSLEADDAADRRRSRTCGPASATRSWSWAATASGTATSTPTTSAPPSRPASTLGRPRQIRVTDLLEQVEELRRRWVTEARPTPAYDDEPPSTSTRRSPCAVVAVATGDGIKRIFHSLGVQRLVTGGQIDEPVDRRPRSPRSRRARPTRS